MAVTSTNVRWSITDTRRVLERHYATERPDLVIDLVALERAFDTPTGPPAPTRIGRQPVDGSRSPERTPHPVADDDYIPRHLRRESMPRRLVHRVTDSLVGRA